MCYIKFPEKKTKNHENKETNPMATMKAARWHAAKDVRIEEVEVPEVQPHQVKVAVKVHGDLRDRLA